jgi:hypothetical protein
MEIRAMAARKRATAKKAAKRSSKKRTSTKMTDEEFESIKVQLRDMTVFKSDKYRATPQAAFRQDAADIVELLSGTPASSR